MPAYKSVFVRFSEKVKVAGPDDCWEWQGAKNKLGYGLFSGGADLGRRPYLAHRFSFQWSNLREPQGCVLHTCDNPSCVNPAHLFEGDRTENNLDRERKGRGGNHKGTRNGRAILTEQSVAEIRAEYDQRCREGRKYGALKALAEKWGVTHSSIQNIVYGRNWLHVDLLERAKATGPVSGS
jgi:hypothetical protein